MSMTPAWDDVGAFIDPDDFGVPAVVSFQAGGTRAIVVLFDDPAAGLQFTRRAPASAGVQMGGYEGDAEKPRMVGTVAALAGIRKRDSVLIDGKTFGCLTGPQPDGNGCATVSLVLES